jgi:hypothetical protein
LRLRWRAGADLQAKSVCSGNNPARQTLPDGALLTMLFKAALALKNQEKNHKQATQHGKPCARLKKPNLIP